MRVDVSENLAMPKTTKTAGIKCKCGSFHTIVVRTTPHDGFTLRRTKCADCGERQTTVERPIHQPPPDITAVDRGAILESVGNLQQSLATLLELSGLNIPNLNNAKRSQSDA